MTYEATTSLGPFLTNNFGDRSLYEVNRNVFDQVGAEAVFYKHFGKSLLRENHFYLLAGTDSGLLLRHLLKRGLPEGSRYIFVELPLVLAALRQEGLLEDLPERIAVVEVQELPEQARAFQFQNYVYLEAAELRESLAAIDGNLASYRELSELSMSWMKKEAFKISANIGIASFMVRQLENLAENRLPAVMLKDSFQGKTAVLLAGGPSLDETLPWVKANRDRLVILAVSRISRQLLTEELFPHFVVSVDPQDISFEVSREMLHLYEHSIFVHSFHVSPQLLGQWRGRSLYLGPLYPWVTPLNRNNLEISGPTVTNSGLTLALELGCTQVVLAGVDLCFNKHGFTHASGSNESQAGPILRAATLQVETNAGGMAYTNSGFYSAIDALNNQAANARARGCRVINPAPGAARITSVEHMALEMIEIAPLAEIPLATALNRISDEDSQSRTEHCQTALRELSRAEKNLKKLLLLAKDAIVCNDGLFGRKGKKADFKYKLQMDTIEKKINTDLADFAPCVKQFGIRGLLKTTRADRDKEWTNAEIEKAGRIYYEAYRDSAKALIGLIQKAALRLRARLEEEKPNPDLSLIVAQWRQDRQPGRFLVWKGRHLTSAGDIPAGFSGHEELLEAEFSQQMRDTETSQWKRINASRQVTWARSKALVLFQRNDCDGLRLLMESLARHPDRERATALAFLVQGYLAELEKKPEQALDAYQSLIGETFTPPTEDALRRITSICLGQNNMEMALQALDCLAKAAVSYKPQYADLLRLTGKLQEAADVFTDYLEIVPADLVVLLKLGKLYRIMGHENIAQQVFQMVLAQEPENQAVQSLLRGS